MLSAAALFLLVGFFAGGFGDFVEVRPGDPMVTHLAEIALFAVLFTDGMQLGARDLASAWRLPGRALVLGMPLTFLITSLLAHYAAGLSWAQSFLIGAVLSPTDPVFASALVGREEVPRRLRRLLNVESGVNDGLVLPVVVILLSIAPPDTSVAVGPLLGELALGVALGVGVTWIALRLERLKLFDLSESYEPLYAFAIGLLVFALASATHANLFLAAFSAGVATVTVSPRFKEEFHGFGELLTELFKLFAVLVFGALIAPGFFVDIGAGGYLFAFLALFAARPVAIFISFIGSGIGAREWAAAAWFGPKGFASVVYGLLVLESGVARSEEMFHLIAVVIAASILLHSSTDGLIARQFQNADLEPEETPR